MRRFSFSFPHELLDDPSFNDSQKRALLCEWASDACAVESFPALRLLPGTSFPVTLSAVMDALLCLDRKAAQQQDAAQSRRGVIAAFARRGGQPGQGPAGRH
jgi:hypothetical protein